MYSSQYPQPPHPHRIRRQPHRQTNDDHMTTKTTQAHIPSSKSEIAHIILQVSINGIKSKLEELKLLIYDTHADIITLQETKLTPKAKTPKVYHSFTTTDIPLTINTHNTELQMVNVHINNTKHISIANI